MAKNPLGGERSLGNSYQLGVLASLFFIWGFCTALNDILVPHLKAVFELNYVQTMLIQFTFFGSYLVLSIPSTKLIERLGYKYSMIVGLIAMGVGCVLFVPAAGVPSYGLFLSALFILAAGITLLQVAANPYVAALGPEKSASARLNLIQGFNSLATVVAPLFGGIFILSQTKAGTARIAAVESLVDRMADARAVEGPYFWLAVVLLLIALVVWATRLPDDPTGSRRIEKATDTLWRHKNLVMGAVAIFVYVGAEVSIGSFLINYMASPHVSHMTTAEGARYLMFYWGGAMVGRFLIGAVMLRYVAPSKMLSDNCIFAIFLIALSMLAKGPLAMWAMLLVGLCNSIMFPTIFTLSIKGLGPLTGRGSGVLVAAIFGGAVIPMLQAALADTVGLTISFVVPAACYVYIWLFAERTLDPRILPPAQSALR
jgi:FHS family L-fucose permease-like MFS transporter